jgi:phosphoglucomutase
MEMAMKKGYEVNADVVLASDPDADRIGVAVRNQHGRFVIINGNQTCTELYLLYYYKDEGERGAEGKRIHR